MRFRELFEAKEPTMGSTTSTLKDGRALVLTLEPGNQGYVVTAEVDGDYAGGLRLTRSRNDDTTWSASDVFLNTEYRRLGIATALYNFAFKSGVRPIVPDRKLTPDGDAFWRNHLKSGEKMVRKNGRLHFVSPKREWNPKHTIKEGRVVKPKLRPSPADIEAIRKIREEIRAEEGGGGMCHWVSEVIMNRYGWTREGGSVVDPKTGDVMIVGHLWNVLPDGAILDATIDQMGLGHDVLVIPKDHPLHGYYRLEWDHDYHPGHPDIPDFKDAPHWKGEFDMDNANRLRAERGNYWYATDKRQHDAYRAQQRAYGKGQELAYRDELSEAFGNDNYIVRWVDEKAIGPYLRLNGMKARVRHILPAKLSGHVHTKPWLGLSFSHLDTSWRGGSDFIGFVVDRTKVKNQCFDINGQEIYDLTNNLDLAKQGAYQFHDYRGALAAAVAASKNEPDEVYVIGDLRNLSEVLVEIRIKDVSDKVRKALTAYCQQHGIRLVDEKAAAHSK